MHKKYRTRSLPISVSIDRSIAAPLSDLSILDLKREVATWRLFLFQMAAIFSLVGSTQTLGPNVRNDHNDWQSWWIRDAKMGFQLQQIKNQLLQGS